MSEEKLKPIITVDVVVKPTIITCPDCGRRLRVVISTHNAEDRGNQ